MWFISDHFSTQWFAVCRIRSSCLWHRQGEALMEKKKREREEESGSSGDGSLVSTKGARCWFFPIENTLVSICVVYSHHFNHEILSPVGDHYLIRYLSNCWAPSLNSLDWTVYDFASLIFWQFDQAQSLQRPGGHCCTCSGTCLYIWPALERWVRRSPKTSKTGFQSAFPMSQHWGPLKNRPQIVYSMGWGWKVEVPSPK